MSYIVSVDHTGDPPYPITITVTCDGDRGLFGRCSAKATFDVGQEHPRDPPHRAGWKIDSDGMVFCKDCR